MRKLILWAMLCVLITPLSLQAAEDALTNLGTPAQPSTLAPGAVILLPDGGQSVILSALPNGDLLTDLGIIISPEGLIRDGEFKGQTARLDPELVMPKSPESPDSAVVAKPGTSQPKAGIPATITPLPESAAPAPQARNAEKPKAEATPPDAGKTPKKLTPEEERALTLAQMLPLTRIEDEKKAATQTPRTQAAQAEEKKSLTPGGAEKGKARPPVKEPDKAGKQAQAREPETQKAQKVEVKPKAAKQKPGEPLRIPPDAAKTGNLSFLEGCWQGTRPEYYSKRIIKECFCFGANGGNGKRRIFDGPQRMCIGGSKAHLSSSGVLSVTSNGAACNDGERWGSAEMVCRNSGPRTPCSWVFKDANNGRQSYEIPFVRVESCGR